MEDIQEKVFKYYFEEDQKKLKMRKKDICTILKCSEPTLATRLNSPGKFTLKEIKLLQGVGFESMKRLL